MFNTTTAKLTCKPLNEQYWPDGAVGSGQYRAVHYAESNDISLTVFKGPSRGGTVQ